MRKQCNLLEVPRSTSDYVAKPESALNLRIKRLLDELYLIDPCLGTRRLVTILKREHDIKVNRKRLQRLRREMGLEASIANLERAFLTTVTASILIPFEQLNRGNGRSTAFRVPGVTRKACKHADQGAT